MGARRTNPPTPVPDEIVSGAKEIARCLGKSESWLHKELRAPPQLHAPKIPVHQHRGGGLTALRSELLEYVRNLPNHDAASR